MSKHDQILSVAHFMAETAVSLVAVRLHTGRRLASVTFDASGDAGAFCLERNVDEGLGLLVLILHE